MTQPTPYVPAYSFTDFSSGSPASQPPGVKLDAEFAAIAETVAELRANLALLQRDDTRLANDSVGPDQLNDAALALIGLSGFSIRGPWATLTVYRVGDIVTSGGAILLVTVAHTSSVLAVDIAADKLTSIFDTAETLRADLLTPSGATNVNFKNTGTGAATRTVTSRLIENVSITDFGATGTADGVADTAAFVAMMAEVQRRGGYTKINIPGTFFINPTVGATVATLDGCEGVEFTGSGKLVDIRTYTGTQKAGLLKFTNACRNIDFAGVVQSQAASGVGFANLRGLTALYFEKGCSGIGYDVDLRGGFTGIQFARAYNDPETDRCIGHAGTIRSSGVFYPYVCQFSGDDGHVDLRPTAADRNAYIYGVSGQRIDIRGKDQQGTTLVKAFSGVGCSDIRIATYDRQTTGSNSGAPHIALEWGDSTPAAFSDIDFRLNLVNPASPNSFGHSVEINKYLDGGSTPDPTARGHILNNFRLSGLSDQSLAANYHLIGAHGALAAGDAVRGINIENMRLAGTNSPLQFPSAAMADTPRVTGVTSDGPIYFLATPVAAKFTDSTFSSSTDNTASTDKQVHNNSTISNASSTQAVSRNQRFRSATIAGVYYSDQMVSGRNALSESTTRSGNLTGVGNIFFVSMSAGVGATFTLEGIMTADQGVNGASRSETWFKKQFTASMNGAGVWTLEQAVADAGGPDATPRSKNTASVPTISLVDGTAAGAFIAIACTNYNGAAARAGFRLDVLSHFGGLLRLEAA